MGNAQSERRYDGHKYYVPSSDEEDEESELETTVAREVAGGEAPGKTSATEAAGATTDGARSQTGVEGATSATKGEPDEPVFDLCGLEPGVGVWDEVQPDPPIRESRLTPEEKTKFRGHLAIIFGEDALMGKRLVFDPEDVMEVMKKVIPYLESESMLIEDVPFDIVIVADLHGQLHDLHRIFDQNAKDGKPGWENMKFLFLGNYVARGRQSLEIVMGLFCLKMLYPDRIFLLRGNYEFIDMNSLHGFPLEIKERYTDDHTADIIYAHVNTAFHTKNLKPYLYSQLDFTLHDMMWSDPAKGLHGTMFNADAGTSIRFSVEVMAYALYNMDCIGLFRGHTMMKKGYDVIGGMCISLFSCTGIDGNKGSIAHIDSNGGVLIKVFKVDENRVKWDAKLLHSDAAAAGINIATGEAPTVVG